MAFAKSIIAEIQQLYEEYESQKVTITELEKNKRYLQSLLDSDPQRKLLRLIDHVQWVQPMYNGTPSCPFCLNQQHWGHEPNCVITKLGIADNSGKQEDE